MTVSKPNEELLGMRNDLTVVLVTLEVLSQAETLPAELHHLVQIALGRQLRAIRHLTTAVVADRRLDVGVPGELLSSREIGSSVEQIQEAGLAPS